ncbi:DUF6581 domain-containing protein [Microdochium nivale]|nr:DUF6581 domain-containing protein [Microdochium nivale]
MEGGLDELIETLLTEIAFSGNRGCSVVNLLQAISALEKAYGSVSSSAINQHATSPPRTENTNDSSSQTNQHATRDSEVNGFASKVWNWLAARNDIFIGEDAEFNNLSLGEILKLPEEKSGDVAEVEEDANGNPENLSPPPENPVSTQVNTDSRPSGQLRPRVFLSDEQQWRLITGHGPDLKRIPKFEWLALVDIASTRTEGILQGNLVRITGQDKRSLPMRTDALAAKGYIIKQSILVRGCRSSKLWLSRFAESAAEDAKREGLPLEQLDLSRETLTSNLDPLPFCDLWTSRPVDYLAIAQAFIAVSKAWDMIRYCDLRTKLGLEQKAPLMRALAKTSRLFTDLGVIRFIGGRFGHSSRIYKDCVKFVREPTEQEWKEFRAVPRNRIQAPSQRLGKRGEAYRASLSAGKNQTPKQKKTSSAQDDTPNVGDQKRRSRHQYVDYEMMSKLELGPLSRVLQKPFPNTVYDIIKRAGDNGSSNTELSQLTLGHGYKKMIAAVSRSISAPPRTASSEPYRVISHKHRVGKIDAYRFFSTGLDVEDMPANYHAVDHSTDSGKHHSHAGHTESTSVMIPPIAYDFTDQSASAFRNRGLQSLTQLAQVSDGRPKSGKRKYKRKMSSLAVHDAEFATVDEEEAVEDMAGGTSSIEGFGFAASVGDKVMTNDVLEITASHEFVETPQGVKMDKGDTNLPQIVVPEKRRRGRPPKNPQLTAATGNEALEEDSISRKAIPQSIRNNNNDAETPASVQVTDAPVILGVYRAPNNALDPPGRKGRPKKSYVVVIRSPKLWKATRNHVVVEDGQASDSLSTQVESQVQLVDIPIKDGPVTIADTPPMPRADSVAVTEPAEEDLEARLKRWKCDICGKRWKNDNGLEYHQKKAKVPCNPNYIPIVKEVSPLPPPSPTRPPSPVSIQREPRASKKTKPEPRAKPKRAQPALPETSKASPRSIPRTKFPRKPLRERLTSQIGSISTSQCKLLDTENAKNKFLQYAQRSSMIITDIPMHHATRTIDTEIQMGRDISPVSQRSHHISDELPSTAETHSDSAVSMRTDVVRPHSENEGYDLPQDISAQPSRVESRIEKLWDDVMLAQDTGGIEGSSKNKPSQLRNERLRSVVEFLLRNNDGVFPGDQSLFSVTSHLWARRYYDMAPPDEKTLRRIVNKMERDGQLTQSFFSFFDEKSQSHNISVLIDPTSIGSLADVSSDPRVLEIKEGVKKYFPNPFSPPGFEFTARNHQAERRGDYSSTYDPGADSVNGDTLEEVEVLPYALPVMTDVTLLGEETPVKAKKRTLIAEKRPTSAKRARLSSSTDPSIQAFTDSQQPSGAAQSEQFVSQPHNAPIVQDVSELPPNDILHIDPLLEQTILGGEQFASEVNLESQTPKTRKKPGPKPGSKRKTKNTPRKAKEPQGSIAPVQATEALSIQQNHEPLVAQNRLPGRTVDYLAASRSEQDAAREWIHDQSIPEYLKASLELSNQTVELADLDDNDLGDFERSVDIVQHWEQVDCSRSSRLGQGHIIPGSIFINHGLAILPHYFAAVRAQWLPQNQLGIGLLPYTARVHNGAAQQARHMAETPQRSSSGPAIKRLRKATPESTPITRGPRSTRKIAKQKAKVLPKRVDKQIDYKIRSLTTLPAAHQGRIHKRRLSTDRMGLRGETDIISAFVIFKVLGGGVEQTSDYGMVLKLFPEQSLSGLKRFWGRVSKERKVHIAALTKVFPKAFLAAYKKGELAPLDYDHFEEYDWLLLVKWTSTLRLYEDIELPAERDDFDDLYELEEPVDQVPDWREMFFSVTSLFGRIDASAGKAASTPAIGSQIFDTELLLRARSWIRSLTRTQIRGPGTGDSVRAKLLELCEGDEESTNQLLEVVVNQLTDEKFATRTKGKRANQSLRLNANFSKHFERNCHVEKFAQAIAFKDKMDAAFREGKELKLSYGADDGTSLAMLNLQAYRRVHVNQTGFRHVPMGHEPGNYEGRKFPKSYYHFTITLTPTDTYMYTTEMQGLEQALLAEVPIRGPRGEIPAWVNLFGQADYVRWIEYLCTFVFAAATRGPVTAQSICLIFKPTFELFEAQLILDFVDRLGLLKRLTATSEGVTVGEWWWLVIGSLLDAQQKGQAITAGLVESTN